MPIQIPPIDSRSTADVVATVESLAKAYSGWEPPPADAPDAGSALIRIFGRMAQEVIDRVNRIPDRSFLAFLNLLGVEPESPRPARVPLTFGLVKGSAALPIVPAGTRVAAQPVAGDTGEVVFETELELLTTRARLIAAFVRQPDQDLYADRTAAATGGGFYPALLGEEPVEHGLYLAADEVLEVPASTRVEVTITFGTADEVTRWNALQTGLRPMDWSYWNGTSWTRLPNAEIPPIPAGATSWRLRFPVPSDIAASLAGGRTARWIRARLGSWPAAPIPAIRSVTMSAATAASGVAPDMALYNGQALDLSMDFLPFGEQPRFNDVLYVASREALSRPGATITVTLKLSGQCPTRRDSDQPKIVWEVWNGTAWIKALTSTLVEPSSVASTDGARAFLKNAGDGVLRTVRLELPAQVTSSAVLGKTNHWLRIRLVGGDFGKGVQIANAGTSVTVTDDGYRPPILESMTLGYTDARTVAATCLAYNDWAFTDCIAGDAGFVPFVRSSETDPALHLGFDRPFADRSMLLYVQVALLTATEAQADALAGGASPPHVVWEYSSPGGGWTPLGAVDETRSFAGSGLIHFVGPTDFVSGVHFGVGAWWLRARLQQGRFAVPPRVGRVLTNTVWATHASTIRGEVLGSSDQREDQTFSLTQTPVLDGERIEVMEAAMPPPDERAEIERLSGEDAVTVVPSDRGRREEIWVRWHAVTDFYGSGPRDRHYRLDHATGQVLFGDGSHGMIPPRGVRNIRASRYRSGGGMQGNRAAGTIDQLKTTVPYVDTVINLEPSSGGADIEGEDRVKERGPRLLRHGHRAVAAEDFEDLAREASPAVARVKAIPPHFDPIELGENPTEVPDAGAVLLVVVPFSSEVPPTPGLGLLRDVEEYIRARSAPAASLEVSGPDWIAISVVDLTIVPVAIEGSEALRGEVIGALERFLHPITGGFDGKGWQFGAIPRKSDVYRLVAAIPGVDSIEGFQLVSEPEPPSDAAADRVLVYSGAHSVRITSPRGVS